MSSVNLSHESRISLLNLDQQLPFEIDDEIKAQLAFAETLIISCGHYDGDVAGEEYGTSYGADNRREFVGEGEESSGWTCTSTTTETPEPPSVPFEFKDLVEEAEPEQEPEEDKDDFHFYFFADCNKPLPPENSKQSILLDTHGMPVINPAKKKPKVCTCDPDSKGDCECHIIMPCKCRAKKKSECICGKLKEICICNESRPNPVCTCFKEPDVCTCFPGLPRPICECEELVKKPCICQIGKYPKAVCDCKFKPTYAPKFPVALSMAAEWGEDAIDAYESYLGAQEDETSQKSDSTSMTSAVPKKPINRLNSTKLSKSDFKKLEKVAEEEPCLCQKPDPKPKCRCQKGKECICGNEMCICGVQKSCICDSPDESDLNLKKASEETLVVCDCPVVRVCTCEKKDDRCKCFPEKKICSCGDPENCKCQLVCDCLEPCICDTLPHRLDECVCLDKGKQLEASFICTCPFKDKDSVKLKKVRAGKQGYRWCRDVDPYHTFFDYAYGLHDKIDYKVQEKERFRILGLYDDNKVDDVCPVHGFKVPRFEKKIRKSSLDCCSSVGGITISVETLGELKDKFLVQVVSNASKEGAKTGSKLVSILDLNLHTLEENRSEHITKRDVTKQRKSYLAICDSGYYNKVTRMCGDKSVTKRLYHTFEQAKKFLLEGSNVVLLRYFGLRRYKGTVKTETVLMDGTICESIYVCPGVSQAVVNGKPLFVVKVERNIVEPNGLIHQTLTVLSLRGHIISHEWADNSYVIHINPLLKVIPEKDEIEDHAPRREKWREDLQLFSDYLDFKSTRSYEGARYVAEHGNLTATVRDYLQAILLLKPSDVVHFTRHYFSSALSSMDLPRDDYFDSCPKHVRYFYIEE